MGNAADDPGPFSLDRLVQAVASVVDAVGRHTVLVGHSMGARDFWGAVCASGHALPPLECECPELMHLNPHLFEAFTYAFQGDVLYDCGQRFRIEGKQYRIKGKGVACKVIYLGTR